MEDLMAKLQNILSTKEGQEQLSNIASMLNLNGDDKQNTSSGQNQPQSNQGNGLDLSMLSNMLNMNSNNSNANAQNNAPPNNNNGFDLSKLASLLNSNNNNNTNNSNQATQNENNQGNNSGFDLSKLAGLLGNNANNNNSNQATQNENNQGANENGFDFSKLAAMLSGMGNNNQANNNSNDPAMPNIDIEMIMKLQKVFASMNVNDKNSQLLLALKPHFSEKRCKKVDQAISMMRLMAMLPMLKESGIFAGL